MQALRAGVVVLAVIAFMAPVYAQQTLSISLFERSLDQLRQESGIPGLSAIILQDRRVVWEAGFGMADVDRSIPAQPDTPYLVGDLTQVLGATLLLQRIDRGDDLALNERIHRWTGQIPESSATIGQVLRHTSIGSYQYSLNRFAAITPVIEYFAREPFGRVLAEEILDKLAMQSSVPGHAMEQPTAGDADLFDDGKLAQYRGAIGRLAVPHRLDTRRRPTRSEFPARSLTAATGLIASARDLARFDRAFDEPPLLLSAAATAAMKQRGGANVPTGLGWFVQAHNGREILWQFGNIPNAYSALYLKIPDRRLTLILLANSDGLSAPFGLERGDVTTSLFASLFLRVFVP